MFANPGPFNLEGQIPRLASVTFLLPAVSDVAFIFGPPGPARSVNLLSLWGRFTGGTSCDIQLQVLRAPFYTVEQSLLPTPNILALAAADTIYSTQTFDSATVGEGDLLFVNVSAVTGSVTWIAVGLQFQPLEV